ncbi:4-alpha-glucanotransferase [Xylanibacter muris]|uniref:4-alpha-glucanotransferase n=1 Tax=Xylanibacter muris TaxID=2736290 RepID=A0ABX2AQX5_9BACT|nr:4-alpha-glucanotransferase [Xylanibacter muris]NPD93105.1 4-alpha-glucanotransferase [Xylanibacter muris]
MKLKFALDYGTAWGERLYVVIEYVRSDKSIKRNSLPMDTADGMRWTVETTVMESMRHPIDFFRYSYHVANAEGIILRKEWRMVPRQLHFDSSHNYFMDDSWSDKPLQHHLYTYAYTTFTGQDKIRQSDNVVRIPLFRKTIVLKVSAPQLKSGLALAVCGSHPALGGWNPSQYVKMRYAGNTEWIVSINVAGISLPFEYKYVVVDQSTNTLKEWELGFNRIIGEADMTDGNVIVADGGLLRVKEDIWRMAGLYVPVFSLRSIRSCGIGDFSDLRRVVEWAASVGISVIDVQSVNDTSLSCFNDSIISVHALNPCYIDIEKAGRISDKGKIKMLHRRRSELNALPYCDDEKVWKVKSAYLRNLYSECGHKVTASDGFKEFIDENRGWLRPYAAFCILRHRYSTSVSEEWDVFALYSDAKVDELIADYSDEAGFIYYVQYILHCQLSDVCDYARGLGIVMMCGIGIGVNRNSVETWVSSQYFNTDSCVGIMPDRQHRSGKNTSIPTYNYEAMESDGYRWWRERVRHMERYFDAVSIDSVSVFFRVWEVSNGDADGRLGHFSPGLPLTKDEIEYFGLVFRKDVYTRPFINDSVLNTMFGVHAAYVKDTFLVSRQYGLYDMKDEYSTSKDIYRYFAGHNDENGIWIRNGIFRMMADVLFTEDRRRPGMYHPVAGAYNEPIYNSLSDDDKEAYMRIYNNYFYQRHDIYWENAGRKNLLGAFGGTGVLLYADNLGNVPGCVPKVLDEQRILTLEVQTMSKNYGCEFSHLDNNPYRSISMVTSPDMPTLRQWWERQRELVQRYYATMLHKEGHAPEHLPAHIAEEIIGKHLYSPSMICMLSLYDWISMDDILRADDVRKEGRGVEDSHGRKYRMTVDIEQIASADKLNRKIKTMIQRSMRGRR